MTSVGTARLRSVCTRGLTVLLNLVSLLSLPGVVGHELGHAAVCRLLGVEISSIVYFRWPADFTRDRSGGGYVQHEPIEATWRQLLVSVAPLVTNTAASLACLTFARGLLDTGVPVYIDGLLAAWYTEFSTQLTELATGPTVAALALTWVGLSLAYSGFPSRQDFRNVGGFLARIRDGDGGRGAAYALEHAHVELATFYSLAVSVVGLFGPRALVTIPVEDVVWYVLVGLAFLGWRVTRGETSWVPDRKRDQHDRVRRLSRRASDGERPDPDEMSFLVETLSDPYQPLRENAALAVRYVAKHHPEALSEYERELLDRAKTDRSPAVRDRLIAAIFGAYEHLNRTDRTAMLGVDALVSAEFDSTHAAPLVTRVAQDSPGALDDRLGEIEQAASRVSAAQRGNLLYAMALIATADGAAEADPPGEGERDQSTGVEDEVGGERAAVPSALPEPTQGATERLFQGLEGPQPVLTKSLTGLGVVGAAYPEQARHLVDIVVPYLDHETDAVRADAARALSRIAAESPEAIDDRLDDIAESLRAEPVKVRRAAAKTFASVAETDSDLTRPHLDVLLDRLDDEDGAVRPSTSLALARVAEDAPAAVGAVEPFIERLDDGETRANALLALWHVAKAHPERVVEPIDSIVARLDDDLDSARSNALGALSAVADERPDLVARHLDSVCSAVEEGTRSEQVNGTSVLATVAETYPEAVESSLETLTSHLDSENEGLRENATEAVAEVVRSRPASVRPVTDALAANLADDAEDVRAAAALALARLARWDAFSVVVRVDELRDATADPDERVAANARSALLAATGIGERRLQSPDGE